MLPCSLPLLRLLRWQASWWENDRLRNAASRRVCSHPAGARALNFWNGGDGCRSADRRTPQSANARKYCAARLSRCYCCDALSIAISLLGSFATAFFLYGIALMFGATGSTSISAISQVLRSGSIPVLAYAGIALMFVGLGFKVAAAPFHIWTPDVYEGAPSPVVGFMSTAPKAAVFAVLLRIMFQAQAPGRIWLIWVAAALSMTIGNIAALVQDNIKRLLAYSSIAHAGYLLVAFAALPSSGIPAAMFYAASYAAMNVGAFAVVSHFASAGERYVTLEDYSGLGRRSPLLAATLTIFLFSLIGIPITGGFFAKFYVFSAALQANLVGLVIIGVLNSAVGAYYYLRVMVVMYMREPREEAPLPPVPTGLRAALTLTVFATIYLGILPGRVLEYASRSATELLRQ